MHQQTVISTSSTSSSSTRRVLLIGIGRRLSHTSMDWSALELHIVVIGAIHLAVTYQHYPWVSIVWYPLHVSAKSPSAPVIECGPGSASSYLVGTADTLPPDWMLRYSLVDHAGSARQAPHQPSLTMIVQPAGDVRAQTVTQQGVYATPPVNEFRNNSNQHEVGNERDSIVLYVVACSASLEADNSNGSTFEWATTSGEIDIS